MSTGNPHIIKAQAFQIEIASQEDAYRIQSNISTLQSTRISQLIDKILTEYHDPNWVISFDEVELDLGSVSKYNYENEIVYRLEEALIDFLKQSISKNGSIRRGKKRRLGVRKLEQFEHFLEKGYLEWNSNKKESPSELLSNLIANDEIALLATLRRIAKREHIRKRIVYHFSEEELEKIVRITAGSHAEYILDHKENIVKQQQRDDLVVASAGSFKKLVWEIIMAYLFAEGRSYFDKKSYLNYLITQIARRHNLTYTTLLMSVSKGIREQQFTGSANLEFTRIIQDLSNEADFTDSPVLKESYETYDSFQSFVEKLGLYLESGQFPKEFKLMDQEEFNRLFRHFLLKKPDEISNLSISWFSNTKKVNHLIKILDSKNQKDLIQRNTSPIVSSAIQFLDFILNEDLRLTSRRSQLIAALQAIKPKIILNSIPRSNLNEATLMEELLHEICRLTSNREDEVFELLNDRLEHVPNKYKQVLTFFLAEFYQKIGANVLDSIGDEVIFFLYNYPKEKWKTWFKYRFRQWQNITGLTFATLQSHIWNAIHSEYDDDNISYILDVLPAEWKRETSMLSSKVQHAKKRLSNQNSRTTSMMIVLEKGRSPWWDRSYPVARFNTELVESLNNPYFDSSEIRIALRKSRANSNLVSWLYPETELKLREVLVGPSRKSLIDVMNTITQKLRSNFLFPGIISVQKYDKLRGEFLRLLVFSEVTKLGSDVIRTLTNWIATTDVLSRNITRNLFVELLITVSKRSQDPLFITGVQKWIKALEKQAETSETNNNKAKTLNEYLSEFNIRLSENGRYTYYDDIISMIMDRSIPLDMLLGRSEFREALIDELNIPETHKVISTQLNSRQQEYFQQTTAYLDLLKLRLSKKEFSELHRKFTRIIFLRLGTGSTSVWKLTDWVKLVIQLLYDTVGITKTDELIVRISTSKSGSNRPVVKIFEDLSMNVAPKIIPSGGPDGLKHEIEEDYRKLGEKTNIELMNPLFINNAGLIILAPYLGVLFERCGLTNNGTFKDNEVEFKAIQLLDYAVTGKTISGEHDLILQKILCGIPVQNPIDISVEISTEQKAIVDDLLVAITQQWPGLENSTIDSLRGSFLIRDGKLEEMEDGIYLKVEQKSFDVLLDRIPWNISSIKLSWMPKLLKVIWR